MPLALKDLYEKVHAHVRTYLERNDCNFVNLDSLFAFKAALPAARLG